MEYPNIPTFSFYVHLFIFLDDNKGLSTEIINSGSELFGNHLNKWIMWG